MHSQLHQIVTDMADRRGDAPALTFKDETVTYAELAERATRFAAGLQELGLTRGDRVAIALDKRIETVVSVVGTSVAGGAFVPVNPVLKAGQVGHILRDCSVRVLVTTAQRLALLREELADSAVEHVVLVDKVPEDAGPDLHDWQSFGAGAEVVAPEAIDVDMAAIFYTSGSTGKPKGVVLSHRNLLTGGASVSQYLENHGDDVILAALPLSFDAGFSQLTTAFTVGAHVVLVNYLLPARRRPAVRQARGHGADLRAAAVDPAHRAGVAGGGDALAALLRQHRRPHAAGDPDQAARDLPRRPSRI